MKVLVQRIATNPDHARVFGWVKLLTLTGSAQLVVQALGLLSGVLVIRLLSTQEYALYTLANTMLGTMIVLADGGVSGGVMAQGGRIWQDREKLGAVLVTGLDLRRKFAVGSLAVAAPALLLLLRYHGASWPMSILISLALVPAFLTALSGTLLAIVPKLRQDLLPLQKIEVGAAGARLVLLGLSLFAFPVAYIAVLAAGLPQIWANWRLRSSTQRFADLEQPLDPAVRQEILVMVRRRLPEAIYYCLSGQITIWLLSFLGPTASVAQAGALNRLGVVITLFNVLFASIILPRFARLPAHRPLLLSRYVQINGGLVALSAGLVGSVWLFSSQVLWVLGPNYAGLGHEAVLLMVGSCLNFIGVSSFFLCTSRGWVINPLVSIPLSIGSIACGTLLIDLSTLTGVLNLAIFTSLVQVVMHGTYALLKIGKVK